MLDLGAVGVDLDEDDSSIAFVLPQGETMSSATYKAITVSGDARYFLPSARSQYNGRDKVTYFIDGYTPLRGYIGGHRANEPLLRSIVDAARTACENGNLSIRCTVFDMDHVFVREDTGQIGLVYIPADPSILDVNETQARQAVFTLCKSALALDMGSESPLRGVSDTPEYKAGDLDYLANCFGGEGVPRPEPVERRAPSPALSAIFPVYELVSRTPGLRVQFRIENEQSVIGRLPERANFVIASSATISGRHCCVTRVSDGSLRVKDLGSTNGTFVNGRELRVGETVPLPEGAVLGLGSSVELLVSRVG